MWAPAQLMVEGNNPYRQSYVLTAPYTASAYGALYYASIGLGVWAFGLQLWFGRVLSLASQVMLVLTVGWLVRRLTGKRHAAVLATLACLSSTPLLYWVAFQRSDVPGLALATVGLALTATCEQTDRRWWFRSVLGGLLMSAGFFTKQVFVLCVPISLLVCFARGWVWPGLAALTTTVIVNILGVTTVQLHSDGGYLWQYLELPRGLEASASRALSSVTPLLLSAPTLIAASLLLSSLGRRRKEIQHSDWVFVGFAGASLAIGLILARFKGSNLNYFLETSVALALILGLFAARLRANARCVLALIMTLGGLAYGVRTLRGEYFRWQSLPY